MPLPGSSIDIARERELYVEAVRRASSLGRHGREALFDAHEVFAGAMLAAGRPELALGAVTSLVAARPGCSRTVGFAARLARGAGHHAQAAEWERGATGPVPVAPFKPHAIPADKRTGAA